MFFKERAAASERYHRLYDLKTRTATSTLVHENLYITHAQNQGKPFFKVLLHGTDVKR